MDRWTPMLLWRLSSTTLNTFSLGRFGSIIDNYELYCWRKKHTKTRCYSVADGIARGFNARACRPACIYLCIVSPFANGDRPQAITGWRWSSLVRSLCEAETVTLLREVESWEGRGMGDTVGWWMFLSSARETEIARFFLWFVMKACHVVFGLMHRSSSDTHALFAMSRNIEWVRKGENRYGSYR